MPSLLNSPIGGTTRKKSAFGTDVFEADTTTYDPALRTVDPEKETVQGQLAKVMDTGSPLMQRAETRAAQQMNQRGLLNSSIAVGAGQQALYDTALPIATADADIYGTAARENQATTNQALQYGATEGNANARANAGELNQTGRAAQAAELEKGLIGTRTSAESTLQAERAAQAEHQTGVEGVQQRLNIGTTGTQERQTQAERSLQAQQLAEKQGQIETGLVGTRLEAEKQITQLRGQVETQLQQLRGTQAQSLANVEATYRTLISANQAASGLYNTTMQDMAAVLADINTSTEQKQAAVDSLTDLLKSGLTIIGGVANIDLTGLFEGEAPPTAPPPPQLDETAQSAG